MCQATETSLLSRREGLLGRVRIGASVGLQVDDLSRQRQLHVMTSGQVATRSGVVTLPVHPLVLFLHPVHAVRSADAYHLRPAETEAVVRLPRDARQEPEDVLEPIAKPVLKELPVEWQ